MISVDNGHDIFLAIKKLNLPLDEYIVVGGGILVALGLHEWDGDVDFAVSANVFQELAHRGWEQKYEEGKTLLKHGDYDIGVNFGEWNLDDLHSDALIINGIPFVSLEKLLVWKHKRNLPKDRRHIEMIEEYLKTH
jgi:hypothetical protein